MYHAMKMVGAATLAAALLVVSLGGRSFAAHPHQTAVASQGRAQVVKYIASVEGVTPADLKQGLKSGKTLLQIAGTKYRSAGDLTTALLAPVKARMDKAVTNKMLTAEMESTLYTYVHDWTAKLVVTPHPLQSLLGLMKTGA